MIHLWSIYDPYMIRLWYLWYFMIHLWYYMMFPFYIAFFIIIVGICSYFKISGFGQKITKIPKKSNDFRSFQWKYLLVYVLVTGVIWCYIWYDVICFIFYDLWCYLWCYLWCVGADWLQGPYVYKLYEEYVSIENDENKNICDINVVTGF